MRRERRDQPEQDVHRHRDAETDPQNGGIIFLPHLRPLDQGRRKAGLDEDIRDRDEDHNEADGPVLRGSHQPRQDQRHDKLHALCPCKLKDLPEEAVRDFAFQIICRMFQMYPLSCPIIF